MFLHVYALLMARTRGQMSKFNFFITLQLIVRRCLALILEHASWDTLTSQLGLGILPQTLPQLWEHRSSSLYSFCYLDSRNLNSGPHACLVRTLSIELSISAISSTPQIQYLIMYFMYYSLLG